MVDQNKLMLAVESTNLEPHVRINFIRESGSVLLEYVGGSHAYGTFTKTSDKDLRGVFCLPRFCYLGLKNVLPKGQVSDDRQMVDKLKNDDIFYTFRRFFELLQGSNPNILEALFIPEDCIVSNSPEIKLVMEKRHLFISRKCVSSHCGYAHDQISKMRGKNKKIVNPQPVEKPKKIDFCRIISCIPGTPPWTNPDVPNASKYPFRPTPLKEMPWIDLKDYHVAAVEHMEHAYRLYCYLGVPCKGVFRGDDMLVCESIPKEDEHARFSGILLYDEQEYERALKEWNSYWEWINNRNIHRWIGKDSTNFQFDHKNAMHCLRLLMSGINIVKNGEPIVRFSGRQQQHLMDIRTGVISNYEDIMAEVVDKMAELKECEKNSSIPDKLDDDAINDLYCEVSEMAWSRLYN